MRSRPVRRLAAALVNLLFLLAWGEPVAACPAHDGLVVQAIAAQHAAAAAAATGGMQHDATAMGAMAAHPASGEHAGHDGAGHTCRCMGQCSLSAGVVAPTAQAIRWQVVVRRLVEPAHAEPAAPSAAAPRLLPFANGPPRTA